jgi:hypothetical protein
MAGPILRKDCRSSGSGFGIVISSGAAMWRGLSYSFHATKHGKTREYPPIMAQKVPFLQNDMKI